MASCHSLSHNIRKKGNTVITDKVIHKLKEMETKTGREREKMERVDGINREREREREGGWKGGEEERERIAHGATTVRHMQTPCRQQCKQQIYPRGVISSASLVHLMEPLVPALVQSQARETVASALVGSVLMSVPLWISYYSLIHLEFSTDICISHGSNMATDAATGSD